MPLRNALSRHFRHQTKTKHGFEVPIDLWLRGPLRQIFEEVVLRRQEILGLTINQKALINMFNQRLSGLANYAKGLWVLLSLALWEKKALSRACYVCGLGV